MVWLRTIGINTVTGFHLGYQLFYWVNNCKFSLPDLDSILS
ncbi:hypothetical protein O53_3928 [Microcystis aeruginosa TAIHU98]|uniref:Uncharacterized protein n=1 Tax=Microcystis aeruginosa TAIHU98 TaxID=1134457 RepID=L7E6N4_MICAE|nr:hypothetical protein O53_3928 [Microcystis aeruginosa TAIHU98]